MIQTFDELDALDRSALLQWQCRRDQFTRPVVGDVVQFADGSEQRVSYYWPDGVQTSNGGSFYMLPGGSLSFSGALNPIVPFDALSRAVGEKELRPAWFFHHDIREAHNGVDVLVSVNVWSVEK